MDILKLISKTLKKYPVTACYLFGSQAKKNTGPLSDWDFAVITKPDVSESKMFDLRIKLAADLAKALKVKSEKVEVVVLNDPKLSYLFRFNIIQEGKLLYDTDKPARVIQEVDIMRKWYDWIYYEELFSKIFREKLSRGVYK